MLNFQAFAAAFTIYYVTTKLLLFRASAMSVTSDPAAKPAHPSRRQPPRRSNEQPSRDGAFGRTFWFAYGANSAVMIAFTLLYRYADFVVFLKGTEVDLGRIVGIGMIGSLLMRVAQGVGIDRYGPRLIWLASLGLFIASLFGHLLITDVRSPAIYLLRIAFTTSLAGIFGASITCVSRSMSAARMAEVIGLLGTSGFIAMPIGAVLGDLICGSEPLNQRNVNLMFLLAAALGCFSLVCAIFATRGHMLPAKRRTPPMLWLLKRYHPGAILLMGIVIGIGVAMPATFLPLYAADLGIAHLGTFWAVYAFTAFMTRVLTRRFPENVGVRPMIFLGMAALLGSLLSYMMATNVWLLMLPGFLGGIAHAMLFPAVVATGSTAFPNRYRGLGTTVMLASIDMGTFVGAPLIGTILSKSKAFGLPPYPTMFLTLAVGLSLLSLVYLLRAPATKSVRQRSTGEIAAVGQAEIGPAP